MKINYLIIAFGNESHLNSLIESLRTDKADIRFFVHYDRKSTSSSKRKTGLDVVFIDPIPVWWGGWSQQQAILNLCHESVSRGADWHVLLSGSDYPIRSNADIILELERGREIITLRKGFFPDKPIDRLQYYYFDGFDRRNKTLKSILYLLIERLLKLVHKRTIPIDNVYHGTASWALSNDCLSYALRQISDSSNLVKFYKNSRCADESLFHTIIGNSPFRSRARNVWVYADWSTKPAPGPITREHIEMITQQHQDEFFFARKFSDSSIDIVEQINKLRLDGAVGQSGQDCG